MAKSKRWKYNGWGRRVRPDEPKEPPLAHPDKYWGTKNSGWYKRNWRSGNLYVLVHILDISTWVVTARLPRDRVYTLCGQRAIFPVNTNVKLFEDAKITVCRKCKLLDK